MAVALEARAQSTSVPDALGDGVLPQYRRAAGNFFDDNCFEVIRQCLRMPKYPRPPEWVRIQVKSYVEKIGLEPDEELTAYYQLLSDLRFQGLPIEEQKSSEFKRLCDQRVMALALLLLNRCEECEVFISQYPNIFNR